jgi:hypothetical protein
MSDGCPDVFASREVAEVIRLHRDLFTDEFRRLSIEQQLARQADRLLEAHGAGNPVAAVQLSSWHPDLVGLPVEAIMNHGLTRQETRETIAREYGFSDWAEVQQDGGEAPDPAFEETVDLLLAADIEALRRTCERDPTLAKRRSSFGHRSTLLHYVAANGVETYRQVVPRNLGALTRVLIDAGADVNATANIYGGGATTIALLLSSSHPAEAGVVDDVVSVLVDAGARCDGQD